MTRIRRVCRNIPLKQQQHTTIDHNKVIVAAAAPQPTIALCDSGKITCHKNTNLDEVIMFLRGKLTKIGIEELCREFVVRMASMFTTNVYNAFVNDIVQVLTHYDNMKSFSGIVNLMEAPAQDHKCIIQYISDIVYEYIHSLLTWRYGRFDEPTKHISKLLCCEGDTQTLEHSDLTYVRSNIFYIVMKYMRLEVQHFIRIANKKLQTHSKPTVRL